MVHHFLILIQTCVDGRKRVQLQYPLIFATDVEDLLGCNSQRLLQEELWMLTCPKIFPVLNVSLYIRKHLLCKVNSLFWRVNFFPPKFPFPKYKRKFGGKKFTFQRNEDLYVPGPGKNYHIYHSLFFKIRLWRLFESEWHNFEIKFAPKFIRVLEWFTLKTKADFGIKQTSLLE